MSPQVFCKSKGQHLFSLLVFIGMGEERGIYRVLEGKPEGKRPMGRPRRIWVDNIRIDLQEVGCGIWTGLGWSRIETGGGSL